MHPTPRPRGVEDRSACLSLWRMTVQMEGLEAMEEEEALGQWMKVAAPA
jgi:hypothetical protein